MKFIFWYLYSGHRPLHSLQVSAQSEHFFLLTYLFLQKIGIWFDLCPSVRMYVRPSGVITHEPLVLFWWNLGSGCNSTISRDVFFRWPKKCQMTPLGQKLELFWVKNFGSPILRDYEPSLPNFFSKVLRRVKLIWWRRRIFEFSTQMGSKWCQKCSILKKMVKYEDLLIITNQQINSFPRVKN